MLAEGLLQCVMRGSYLKFALSEVPQREGAGLLPLSGGRLTRSRSRAAAAAGEPHSLRAPAPYVSSPGCSPPRAARVLGREALRGCQMTTTQNRLGPASRPQSSVCEPLQSLQRLRASGLRRRSKHHRLTDARAAPSQAPRVRGRGGPPVYGSGGLRPPARSFGLRLARTDAINGSGEADWLKEKGFHRSPPAD